MARVVNSAIPSITEALENKVASFSEETRPSQYCLAVLSALKYTVREVYPVAARETLYISVRSCEQT